MATHLEGTRMPFVPAVRRRSVLIIHDDVDAADVMRLRIRAYCACDTSVANGFRHALDEAGRVLPDVVVLDVDWPATETLKIVRQLRADARFSATMLIALTGYPGAAAASIEAGCDHHLPKPPDMHALRALIQGHGR